MNSSCKMKRYNECIGVLVEYKKRIKNNVIAREKESVSVCNFEYIYILMVDDAKYSSIFL